MENTQEEDYPTMEEWWKRTTSTPHYICCILHNRCRVVFLFLFSMIVPYLGRLLASFPFLHRFCTFYMQTLHYNCCMIHSRCGQYSCLFSAIVLSGRHLACFSILALFLYILQVTLHLLYDMQQMQGSVFVFLFCHYSAVIQSFACFSSLPSFCTFYR